MQLKITSSLPSREFGLILGSILGRFCLKMEDLHYGFWSENLAIEPQNLAKAQTQYTEFLLSHIPEGVETILDVGCGTGNTARNLLDCGYRVDCVSPNSFLTEKARDILGSRVTFFECRFEDLQTDKRYDLLLFSESFLFMHPEAALSKSIELLKEGGHMLLSDLFKIVPDGKTAIGGGQHLSVFYETISRFPFHQLKDIDITSRIAPTFTLIDNAYTQAIKPAYDLIIARLRTRHPWAMRLLWWKFRATIQKYENKHFSGQRTAETFARIKSYRVFLYRKI